VSSIGASCASTTSTPSLDWTALHVDYGNSGKDKLRSGSGAVAPARRGKDRRIPNDAPGEGFEAFLHDACINLLSVTKGAVYVCMSSSELHSLHRAFTRADGKWSTFVI
jgi:hypothetical protein